MWYGLLDGIFDHIVEILVDSGFRVRNVEVDELQV
jgi:hypothetical protein